MLFEIIKSAVFGVLEGVCEWLPISSTGHLILLEEFLSFKISESESLNAQFASTFDVVIQLGAILAVILVYLPVFNIKKRENRVLWRNVAIATLPAAIIGIIADTLCEKHFGRDLDAILFTPTTVAIALIFFGILFIITELFYGKRERAKNPTSKNITPLTALSIGFFQALAIIPGTSRSGATILGARLLGVSRRESAKFSFFLAIPVILGASLLKISELSNFLSQSGEQIPVRAILILAVAFTISFLVSAVTIKFLTEFVKKHSFIPFGIYRIALGIAVLIFLKA